MVLLADNGISGRRAPADAMVRGMNVTGIEALVLVWIVPVVILYFVVRLAVRHGIKDARRDHA